MNVLELIACNLFVVLGATLQASAGIGLSLVAVPLLALINPAFIPGPILFANLLLTILMAFGGWGAIDQVGFKPIVIGLFAGTGIGSVGLMLIPVEHLPTMFGILILVAVALSAIGIDIPLTRRNLIAAGAASGVMGTMTGIHGPPIALLYQRQVGETVRATLGVSFAIAYSLSLGALHLVSLFGIQELKLGVALGPGVVLGYWVSKLTTKLIDQGYRLRITILTISALGAIVLLWKS